MSDQEDTKLIPLAQLAKDNDIPLRTLRRAITDNRMWGVKQGRDWFSTVSEVKRFKTMWRKHST